MTDEPYCCFIPCDKVADWAIYEHGVDDIETHACTEHVGYLLTDSPEQVIYRIHHLPQATEVQS